MQIHLKKFFIAIIPIYFLSCKSVLAFELKSIHIPVLEYGYLTSYRANREMDKILDELASTGANEVLIEQSIFLKDKNSSDVMDLIGYSESDRALAKLMQEIKERGMNIAFKPSLKYRTPGDWTGKMQPSDMDLFFESYKKMLLKYAKLSQENGVSTLYLGNELGKSVRKKEHQNKWLDMISSVKDEFKGQLSINLTIYDHGSFSIPIIPFADQLDFIGISFYPKRYTWSKNPSVNELVNAWHRNADKHDMYEYLHSVSKKYNKPVAISEIAYRSLKGHAALIHNGSKFGEVDEVGQANLYSAFFKVWNGNGHDWFKGVSFWGWFMEYRPTNKTRRDAWYGEQGSSVQGKLAMEVLREGFQEQ